MPFKNNNEKEQFARLKHSFYDDTHVWGHETC